MLYRFWSLVYIRGINNLQIISKIIYKFGSVYYHEF